MNLCSVLTELDFQILALKTGASAEYIELVINGSLPPNKAILKLAEQRALTKLIETQTTYIFKFFNN